MSETSTLLSLPYLMPAQAQKHVTHNEALRRLDAIVQLAVLDRDRQEPPAAPAEGDRHIVAPGGYGDWAGHDGQIAVQDGGIWQFIAPGAGWRAEVLAEALAVVFDGTGWTVPVPVLENLDGVGIGTTSDAGNRLAVASAATLLSHAGAGHQVKVNKAAAGDTASLLFQTGWSGRAEMGTAGTDDFAIKVSADGSLWTTALNIEAATGKVSAPGGGLREMLTAPRTYYVDAAAGNDANTGLTTGAGGAFKTIARALQAVHVIDAGGQGVKIKLADGTYAQSAVLIIDFPVVGARWLTIEGNIAAPSQVVISSPETVLKIQECGVKLSGMRLQSTGSTARLIDGYVGGIIRVDNLEFGPAGGHISMQNATLLIEGPNKIASGAAYHIQLKEGASARGNGQTITLSPGVSFTTAFANVSENSMGLLSLLTFSGSATGKRYHVELNAVLDTNASGQNYFPGDLAGTTASGGRYV